jgi:HSP20 family protein
VPISRNLIRNLEDISQILEQAFRGERGPAPADNWVPTTDVFEADEAYLVILDLPGVRQEDLNVGIDGNNLKVSGDRPYGEPEGSRPRQVERSYGSFSRAFPLPLDVDREAIKASFKDGVLTLRLPRKPEGKPRTIRIDIED